MELLKKKEWNPYIIITCVVPFTLHIVKFLKKLKNKYGMIAFFKKGKADIQVDVYISICNSDVEYIF